MSPGYAAGKSEYLQQYLPIVLHASVLIVWALICLAGLVMGIAFAGLGTEVFIVKRGQFSGAGITAVWPGR